MAAGRRGLFVVWQKGCGSRSGWVPGLRITRSLQMPAIGRRVSICRSRREWDATPFSMSSMLEFPKIGGPKIDANIL